jgi:hypothetical protein
VSRTRRRIGSKRPDEACARFRGPQRVLQGGPHEIEDVAVTLGELTLGATESCNDRLTTLGADADRDGVLDAGSVQQVAVQLAVGQTAGVDGLGEAQCRPPAVGMRVQERVTSRVAHDRRKRGRRLGLGGNNLVIDRARRELDAIPRQHIGGHELDEPGQRQPAQLRHRPRPDKRADEAVRGIYVCVGKPRHGVTAEASPPGVAGRALPSGLGCLALAFAKAALRPRAPRSCARSGRCSAGSPRPPSCAAAAGIA